MGLIIDTNVFVHWERNGHDIDFSPWQDRGEAAISVVTASELLVGVHRADTQTRRDRRSAFVESILTQIPILDILHALAYVWEAASLFEKADSARRAFTRERLLKILRGEVSGVIQGLRSLGTRRGLRGEKLKSLGRICGYLEKNTDRMRYDEYLRRGYPIASGVIEGACRHLVKDRMERSGMRWTLEGARSMLNVRAAFQSDHWRTFVDWHMKNEITSTHLNRELLQGYTPPTLAC